MNDAAQTRARAPGRRPGPDSTRKEILQAARAAFAATGFDGTSVRAVAVRAGVDPSTVIHFFGTKDGLFRAVISDVAPATRPVTDALRRRAPGTELASAYLRLWDDEDTGPPMRALIRASFGSERAVSLLREALLRDIIAAAAGADPLGTELALTHLIGIAIGRHIARLPELSKAGIADIADRIGPVLDAYLQTRHAP